MVEGPFEVQETLWKKVDKGGGLEWEFPNQKAIGGRVIG